MIFQNIKLYLQVFYRNKKVAVPSETLFFCEIYLSTSFHVAFSNRFATFIF